MEGLEIKTEIGFDTFWLKIIAIIAMTFDHVGYMFFPGMLWMRVIGRLTLPVMAFMIAEGYRYTKDLRRYERRLFILALVSMIPHYLAFNWPLSVIFTLFAGLLALDVSSRYKNEWKKAAIVAAFALMSIPCDWGVIGVLTIYIFGRMDNKRLAVICGVATCFATSMLKYYILDTFIRGRVFTFHKYRIVFALLLAIPLLLLYNGKRGRSMKMLFYIYYPAHLMILGIILRFDKIMSLLKIF